MQRIVIVGVTGSGKTTLANSLSERLSIRHVEMDSIYWLPGWQERDNDEMRAILSDATAESGWVLDGNYSFVRDIVWARADTLIWLDYPLWQSMRRLFGRIMRRAWTRELLWGTNQDRLYEHFFTRKSLFWWAIKSRRKHRRDYPVLFQQPEYAHLNIIRLRSTHETDEWLAKIKSSPVAAADPDGHTSAPQAAR